MQTARHAASVIRLSLTLAEARFKLRTAGSYLGIFWYLLEPLAFFFIILLLRSNLGVASIPRYQGYVLLGLIMVNFFINTTGAAIRSIRDNRNLIKSINIDREALPISMVIQFCFSHVFEFILFILFMLYYGGLSWTILLYPFVFAIYAVFTLGVSFIVSTLGVFVEDLDNIWSVVSRLLWLAIPIFYVLSPGTLLYTLNLFDPISYFLALARQAIVYGMFPSAGGVILLTLFSFAMALLGYFIFMKNKGKFAEFL